MTDIRHAIFDLDGTLLDSMWIWENLDIEFLRRYGKAPEQAVRDKVKTLSIRQSAELFQRLYGLPLSVERIMDEFNALASFKYRYEARLKPNADEFLRRLKQEGIKMCLLTASTCKNVTDVLTRLNLYDLFEFVITGEQMIKGKEEPDPFLACAERFKMPPDSIIVFEDALHAAETAKKAGFKVVGVYDRAARTDMAVLKQICDCFIEDFKEIMDMRLFLRDENV